MLLNRLLDRDGAICHICREPIDLELAHPHPESATVDHVESLMSGGRHSPDNASPAHRRCNLEKAYDEMRTAA